jgi:feruloyl esterase
MRGRRIYRVYGLPAAGLWPSLGLITNKNRRVHSTRGEEAAMKDRLRSLIVCSAFLATLLSYDRAAAAGRCEGLAALPLPQVTITTAQTVPPGSFTAPNGQVFHNLPGFCRVVAFATPTPQSHINFEVWMPINSWNKRFRGEGSGGSAGAIGFGAMANGLQHLYATMANDNGHTGSIWTFAQPPERVVDFGHRAQHVTTVAGKAITEAFYGHGPQHSYFVGCSQGGHHGLMEAQRYPGDYDGIVAGDPGNDWTHLMFAELWTGVNTSVKGPSFDLPQAQLNLTTNAALAQCTGRDGGLKSDAFLNDPRDCHFDPRVLSCKANQDPATCLTADQLQAIEALYQGPVNPRTHRQIFPGFAVGSETFWRQVLVGLSIPGGSSASFFRDGVFAGQANFNFLNINFDSDVKFTDTKPAAGGETWAQALNANNPDLTPFRRRGGKLVMYHGFADPFVTPFIALDYYTAVIGTQRHDDDRDGGHDGAVEETRDFARLFMVPGMNHCAGGPGANVFNGPANPGGIEDPDHDVVMALDRWVSAGVAPKQIIATKFVDDTPSKGVAFTRPLCPYPEVARYKGTGDPTYAANFACVVDDRDSNGPRLDDFVTPGHADGDRR